MDRIKAMGPRRPSRPTKDNLLRRHRRGLSGARWEPPMALSSPRRILLFASAAPLAVWFSVWTMKPTPVWKGWWRAGVDWAGRSLLGEAGLYALVLSFPPLMAAAMAYLSLHLESRKGRRIRRAPLIKLPMSNPVIVLSSVGVVSAFEILAAAALAALLSWTFFCGLAGDLKKPTPEKLLRLHLSRLQVRVMQMGIRMGSLAEICLAVLLFPVLRRMAVLKLAGVQFEAAVRYHVWIGNLLTLTAAAHGAAVASVWVSKNTFLSEMMKWPRTGKVNAAGAAALVVDLIMWATSLPVVRRKSFHLFYSAHHLHAAFYVFFLLHAGARHFHVVAAGVLLVAVDRLTRVILSRPAATLVSARILPCRAIELTLSIEGVDYAPTSFMFVNVPAISKFQWHPFSITSSSSNGGGRISFLIKCGGKWTGSLYKKIKSMQSEGPAAMKSFAVAVEGPYGPPSPPYERYEALIMVAGGSGITPFLSVLRDIAGGGVSPARIGLVYAVRKAEELAMLGSISHLLMRKKGLPELMRVKIFVTGERNSSGVSAGELIDAASQASTLIESSPAAAGGGASSLGFRSMAAATGVAFIVYVVSLVGLSHYFLGIPGSVESPSWVTDIVVLASLAAAVAGGAAIAVLLTRRTMARPQSHGGDAKSEDEQDPGGEKLEIFFGSRPDLRKEVEGLREELGRPEVGVFVCGPASMQEAVAELCRGRRLSGEVGHARNPGLAFHSINFSL